jgi:hypothetical protein
MKHSNSFFQIIHFFLFFFLGAALLPPSSGSEELELVALDRAAFLALRFFSFLFGFGFEVDLVADLSVREPCVLTILLITLIPFETESETLSITDFLSVSALPEELA